MGEQRRETKMAASQAVDLAELLLSHAAMVGIEIDV